MRGYKRAKRAELQAAHNAKFLFLGGGALSIYLAATERAQTRGILIIIYGNPVEKRVGGCGRKKK